MHTAVQTDDAADTRRLQLLESLGNALGSKRQAAITHRANSGIEQIWTEDEEHYMGIDDANRDELGATVEKPTTSGSRTYNKGNSENSDTVKSTVFPNITQPYVDAAAARISDMLLPTDDRNFVIEPTPIPELSEFEEMVDENAPPALPPDAAGASSALAAQPPVPGGAPAVPPAPPVMVRLPNGEQVTLEQLREKIAKTKATAKRRTDAAQTQIDDWLTECDYLGETRAVIDDSAKVGTGVIKGPAPVMYKRKVFNKLPGGDLELTLIEKIAPGSKHISYWNLYPDPACGENIHKGSWIWEVDTLSEKGVKALRGLPGYIDSQLDRVLEEGPAKYTSAGKIQYDGKTEQGKGQFQIWYFHGTVSRDDIEAAGCECPEGTDASFEALITMINDHVVRAALNPLDSGEFPYDVMRWKRRPGHWAGVGVGRQMRTAQRMVTAATRNLMDNAGLGAGPMFVFGRGIRPQNNIWEIKPRKIFVRDEDDDDGRPTKSEIETIVIPMLQVELTNIIQLGMKMAEDSTGLPMLLQGQQGSAPDTVGGLQMLNNNANAVLRRIARLFDTGMTVPHIQRYYDWLMMFGEDPEAKGDMFVKARGSSALVERDAQTMELAQIVALTANPIFGKDPKKAMDEYLKSRRFNPDTFSYTKEEQAKIDSQPPAPPPQIAAAQIRAETELKKTEMVVGASVERTKVDTDRDRAYVEAETQRTQREHEARMAELAVKERLAMLEYATQQKVSLDRVKADLAKTAMTLRTQRELAGADNQLRRAEQVAKPAFEPKGRAQNGKAFQQ
jgi:hypothetical protein